MEGRRAGTPGGERAARYLADRLAAAGLTPGGDGGSFLQSFVVGAETVAGPDSALERVGPGPQPFALTQDGSPHGGSSARGLPAADKGWDDYAGVDVRDKIALMLDGAPPVDIKRSRLEKLIAARQHGARAALVLSDTVPPVAATAASVRIVSGTITPSAADRLLEPSGKSTASLRARLSQSRVPQSFATGVQGRMRVGLVRQDQATANVIGILRGTDPTRADEVVVLGAHYDHLGRSGDAVHPGADDNASGTAVVLGLARAFATAGGTPRTLVFVLFGGEEE